MDSKLIFITCRHMLIRFQWPKLSQAKDSSEWVFIDSGSELRSALVLEMMVGLCKESTVYLLKGRHDSREIPTTDLLQVVRDNDCNLILMKMNFSIAAEFRGEICRLGFRP